MKKIDPVSQARSAVASNPTRPATAVIHDSPEMRLVVFRIGVAQQVAVHTSKSRVMLQVLEGSGVLVAGDSEFDCAKGDVVVYEPGERHGMKSIDKELLLLATITPRPGSIDPAAIPAKSQ
jgi:quercetin dioxygenase-like cupin family protein